MVFRQRCRRRRRHLSSDYDSDDDWLARDDAALGQNKQIANRNTRRQHSEPERMMDFVYTI